ncbi:MAG TPA: hypothetical protein VHB70_02340 [Parafilimonas sp.]|nr:hypothetical protein [Parafilimonas sp.]
MTKQFYQKYGWALITGLLLIWIIFTPSHFQKGGVDEEFYFVIAFFVTFISILICLLFDTFSLIEKLLISIPFAFVSLFIMSLILGPLIVDFFYNDKTWFLWQTKHRLFINSIYYGLNAAILSLLANMYFKLRRLLEQKKNK